MKDGGESNETEQMFADGRDKKIVKKEQERPEGERKLEDLIREMNDR